MVAAGAAGADVAGRSITATLKGGEALSRHLQHIVDQLGPGATVNVGFLADSTYLAKIEEDKKAGRKPAGKNPELRQAKAMEGGLHVAQVALWNEFGTKHSPARPFIRNMIASKSPRWGNALGIYLRATNYDSEMALARMGEGIQAQMVQSIVQFKDPPNAPYTIQKKGFDKPLIDQGIMQRSVDYQVIAGTD